jgi:hypothetical protein
VQIDPYENDPGRWAHSLINHAELVFGCLDAAEVRTVAEVGAYAGDLTRLLVDWASERDGRVWAIDPHPEDRLVQLDAERSELELVREPSLAALERIPLPDAVIIDGDHNYYTVSEELSRIAARTSSGELPLLLFHDVCWPHGRRDAYFAPDEIPEEHRQPMAEGATLFPGVEGTRTGGLPYRFAAEAEGGLRNGVLTAVEDFVGSRDDVRFAIVPVFFGLGVVWRNAAPWAETLGELLDPWDRHPLLERLEENRVLQLAAAHFHMVRAAQLEGRSQRLEALLSRMLESSAFGLAERLSRARQRMGIASEQSAISKDAVRRALAAD